MVDLNKNEKRVLCIEFAFVLPRIREILRMTQKEFGAMCGISVDRLSRIENGHAVMTWGQYTSILFVCMMNLNAKEYLFSNNILTPRTLQYFQQKDTSVPPTVNIVVHEEIESAYFEKNREE